MKQLSTPCLVFIIITNFDYNFARVFEKEILVTIEEIRDEGGAKLKLHPLTTMSQVEKKRLCSAAKEIAFLSDDPKESKLYTRLYKMKPDNGKEGTVEELSSSAVEDTSASLSDNYFDRMHQYAQLHKMKSGNESEGGANLPSSRSLEETASLLEKDYTESNMRALLSSMQLNNESTPHSLFIDKEMTTDSPYPDVTKPENEKEDVAPDALTSAAKEGTSFSNDSFTQTDMNLDLDQTIIPESEIEDFMEEYEEDVALVCPTTPVVHLSLGELSDEIKIMFSYVFSVEAIHSITPVPDHEVENELKRNHLLAFEHEQLHALCNTTRKCVPIEDVVFKNHEIIKPQIFEIAYLPHFERPKRRDVVITCPLNPYTAYLRYQPPNEMKIMVKDAALIQLLKKYGFNADVIIRTMKMPAENVE